VIISVTADIDQSSGRVSNRGLAVAKARDAEQGPVAPFRLDYVKLGIDADGDEFGTRVVRADPERGQKDVARSKAPKGVLVFDSACKKALGEHSEEIQIQKEGPKIRAVELGHVKAEFCRKYVTGETDPKRAMQTSHRAWRRVLNNMPDDYANAKGADGREWLYLKTEKLGRG